METRDAQDSDDTATGTGSPVTSRNTLISTNGADEAMATGYREATARTASTAPGSTGRCAA